MIPLQPNPKTGFLESNRICSFDSNQKVKFLEMAKELASKGQPPNVAKLSELIGIHVRTYWDHMEKDERFNAAWREVEDICEANLVDCMYLYAQRPSNYMDRITWLRAKKPERWNPDLKIRISQDSPSAKGLNDSIKGAIDADIVSELPGIQESTPATRPQDAEKP